MTQEEFITICSEKFNHKYDYSLVVFKNTKSNIKIICPQHGLFEVRAFDHLHSKYGCALCAKELKKYSTSNTLEFVHKCLLLNIPYDLSQVTYKNATTKVKVICPKHGEFLITPNDLLHGHGCPKCKSEALGARNRSRKCSTELFIAKCKVKFGDLFSYNLVEYVNSKTPITVYSNIQHEYFQIRPDNFLQGNVKLEYLYDIPKGSNLSKGELCILTLLDLLNLSYESLYLVYANLRKYYVDFCIKGQTKKIFIEFNGILHYVPVDYFGGIITFNKQQVRDAELRTYCKTNNITLLEYSYLLSEDELKAQVLHDLKDFS